MTDVDLDARTIVLPPDVASGDGSDQLLDRMEGVLRGQGPLADLPSDTSESAGELTCWNRALVASCACWRTVCPRA